MLNLPQSYADEIVAHAREDDPNECCGILAGKDTQVVKLYRIANTARSPYRYLMDPQEQLNAMLDLERNGCEILAFYHSHTHTAAYPSSIDVRMALQSGWLDVIYLLVSLMDKAHPTLRAFRIVDGSVTEEELAITPS